MRTSELWMAGMVLVVSAVLTSCNGNLRGLAGDAGPRVTESRSLKGFEEIEISGSPSVYYTQADSFSVRVVGPEAYVENILTEVDGKTLKIRNRGKMGIVNFTADYDDAGVYVTSPDLTALLLSGSGDFESDRRVDTDRLSIILRGSGDIDFKDIICDRCEMELIGSGDLDIDRLESQQSKATLVGSGDIKVTQWNVTDTDVSLRGSGDIVIRFVEGCGSARCQLTGSGDITLSGRLGHFSGEKHGSGDIDIDKLSVEK